MRIFAFSRRADAEPLNRVIAKAANDSGRSRYEVARTMTFFFEHLAEEVAHGRVVSIPGFGAFGAWLDERKSVLAKDPIPRCRPEFSPARGLREMVALTAPFSRVGKRKLTNHRKSHSLGSSATRTSSRVFTSAQAIRDSIDAQLGGCYDWPEPG
ncbi:MAG: hypothetical protein AAF368_10660, partial [Planctomycetota bacterium]